MSSVWYYDPRDYYVKFKCSRHLFFLAYCIEYLSDFMTCMILGKEPRNISFSNEEFAATTRLYEKTTTCDGEDADATEDAYCYEYMLKSMFLYDLDVVFLNLGILVCFG